MGLAFDTHSDLFVANLGGNSITKFAAGSTPGTFGATSILTAPSLDDPEGLAFDAQGDLFAANAVTSAANSSTIMEFASTGAGTFGAGTVVETGFNDPAFLAFGPSAVPEASTTVSFGLLLALGMGGLVITARRRKA